MRQVVNLLTGLMCIALLGGCTGESQPAGPGDPVQLPLVPGEEGQVALGGIAGLVVDSQDVCIPGVFVQILTGRGTGMSAFQDVCDDGDIATAGFQFKDLPLGTVVTMRVTAENYIERQFGVYPESRPSYITRIRLERANW